VEDYQLGQMPAVAPVGDLSGNPSVLIGTSLYELHAFNIAGLEAPGFPKFTGGAGGSSPTAADLDGGGKVSVFLGTKEGRLFVWDTTGGACQNNESWTYHHDEWNSGAYGTDSRPPGAITDLGLQGVSHDPSKGGFTASWHASGGDFSCGTAAASSMRISDQPITAQNFAQATEVSAPAPSAPRTARSVAVSNVAVGQCLYVALQTRNAAGNRSPLAETVDGPGCVIPTAVVPDTSGPGGRGALGLGLWVMAMAFAVSLPTLRRRMRGGRAV
jgi:hypothetical protein